MFDVREIPAVTKIRERRAFVVGGMPINYNESSTQEEGDGRCLS